MIRIKGQLIGDVRLNGTSHIMVHRFVVVEELVVPIILGIDLLNRLGKVTFDFHSSKIQLHQIINKINLLHDYGTLGGKLVIVHEGRQEMITVLV